MFVVYSYACKFVIGFSDDRGGKFYFSTAHGHYFCLSVCLLIILNTAALVFSIVRPISHGTAHNKDSLPTVAY